VTATDAHRAIDAVWRIESPRLIAAWLMATAKHRAIDLPRRRQMLERKHAEIGRELEARQDETAV